jgi:hypothetical protein
VRLLNPDESEVGIYATADKAPEKITLWKSDNGMWWVVARTGLEDGSHTVAEVAYQVDGTEPSDKTITRWAEKTYRRARHPEDEVAITR